MRYARCQLTGAVQVDRQIAQIAVIDTDDFGFQFNGAIQFFFITGLRQHPHVKAVSNRGELNVLIVIEH
ncbi:hypothetical protein SRABI106_04774 [Rahnella aquatilis]|nr:hypothetical protein SRABI106_04774 [Rahnella aquatilis]